MTTTTGRNQRVSGTGRINETLVSRLFRDNSWIGDVSPLSLAGWCRSWVGCCCAAPCNVFLGVRSWAGDRGGRHAGVRCRADDGSGQGWTEEPHCPPPPAVFVAGCWCVGPRCGRGCGPGGRHGCRARRQCHCRGYLTVGHLVGYLSVDFLVEVGVGGCGPCGSEFRRGDCPSPGWLRFPCCGGPIRGGCGESCRRGRSGVGPIRGGFGASCRCDQADSRRRGGPRCAVPSPGCAFIP